MNQDPNKRAFIIYSKYNQLGKRSWMRQKQSPLCYKSKIYYALASGRLGGKVDIINGSAINTEFPKLTNMQ